MVTLSERYGQDLWQFEETGPHAGNWSRVVGEMNNMFKTTCWKTAQSELPRLVSADSNGRARIICSRYRSTYVLAELW